MKKYIIIFLILLFACTKDKEVVSPSTDTKTHSVHLSGVSVTVSEDKIVISTAAKSKDKSTRLDAMSTIEISRKKPYAITQINALPGNETVSKTIQPVKPLGGAIVSGSESASSSCPMLSEIETILKKRSSQISMDDYCTILQFLSCLLSNPSQYGTSSLDLDDISALDADDIALICGYVSCPACSALSSQVTNKPLKVVGTINIDGVTYNGTRLSCSKSNSSNYDSRYMSFSTGSSNSSASLSVYNSSSSSSSSTSWTGSLYYESRYYYAYSYNSSNYLAVTSNSDGTLSVSGRFSTSSSGSTSSSSKTLEVSATIGACSSDD
ncbi:MAG: hypothetical protein NW207_12115 [Cytophagales bacterium]|nr:hypothetical protein [Cytophagales bacterium]